ncbi:MAG: hypothetical protein ABI881_13145 [Betaproteobacteria bacterium]
MDAPAPSFGERSEDVTRLQAEVPFSLFEDDRLQRAYAYLGLGSHTRGWVWKRCLVLVAITWVPVALLAWRQGLVDMAITPTNFFADFAAYAQFLVGLPLFVAAEVVVDRSTREAARQFVACGIVSARDTPAVYRLHDLVKRLRRSVISDVACIVIGYAISFAILIPEFGPDPLPTWHAQGVAPSRMLTAAGIWEFFIALPVLQYIWLRFAWKILLWVFYLYRMTRFRLDLHPTHPDLTGGIGFISEAQGRFALYILAYGISNVAATVGYEIAVLNYDLSIMPVWGPLVGFAIGAPLLFTLPLFMFTKQLYRSKSRALAAYRERVTEHSRRVESRLFVRGDAAGAPNEEMRELAELATLGAMFSRIENMRVVPFDLRSFGQLVGSTLGSLATLLPLLHGTGDLARILEAIGKLFGHLGGSG